MLLSSTIRRPLLGVALLLTLSCGGGEGGGTTEPTPNPTPSITTIVRDTATAGVTPFTVSLGGTDFMPGVVATFDGNTRNTNRQSSNALTFLLQAADLATPGDHEIRVKNPEPGGGPSSAILFHVLPQPPVPVLDSITPDSVIGGTLDSLRLQLYGSHFRPNSTARRNGGALATTFVDSTHITALLTVSQLSSPGTVTIAVVTPGPGGGTSATRNFVVVPPPPAPHITATLPASVTIGPDTVPLQISGTTFRDLDSVTLSSSAQLRRVIPTLATDTSLTISLDRTWLGAMTDLTIRVYTAWGTSVPYIVDVHNPVPVVTGVSPDTVDGSRSQDTVYVSGSGFVTGMNVYVAGIPAQSTTVLAPDSIRAILGSFPLLLGGVRPLAVFDALESQMSDSIDLGIRSPVPTLDSIAGPQVDSVGSSVTRVLWGTGFRGNGEVLVNGNVHPVSSVGDRAEFLLDAQDTDSVGTLAIAYRTPGPGGGTTAPVMFQILPANPAAAVDSVDVDHLSAGGDRVVNLTGHDILPGAKLQVGRDNSFLESVTVPANVVDPGHAWASVPDSLLHAGEYLHLRILNPLPARAPQAGVAVPVWSAGIRQAMTFNSGGINNVVDIVADDQRGLVYIAQVASIRAIDPVDGHQVKSLALPSAIKRLIISSDSLSLWAAMNFGGPTAYRIDLATWTIVDSITPASGPSGAAGLVALPGGALAVQYFGPNGYIIGIFDGSVERPTTDSINAAVRMIGMLGPDTLLANTTGASWELIRLVVDSAGVHEIGRVPYPPTFAAGVVMGHTVLFGNLVVDALSGATIASKSWGASLATIDPAHSRFVVVSGSSEHTEVFGVDPATGAESAADIAPLAVDVGPISRFGGDGLVFQSGSVELIFLRAAAIEN